MHDPTVLLVVVVIAALAFDYINGFHDTANAIATVVSTRVLSPRAAIVMSAVLNFVGAILFTHVAKTISGEILTGHQDPFMGMVLVLAAVVAGIAWNLITWAFGIPSSSSHALIGGLCGAAMAASGPKIIKWGTIVYKVVIPVFASPIAGFLIGFLLMLLVFAMCGKMHPGRVGGFFRKMQIASSAAMAFAHGQNDAQKSMGIITLGLVTAGQLGAKDAIPLWVKFACALAMALGTSAGGWRIIKTMGHKIIRLEPVHGFAAETAGATVIVAASVAGIPVSTTHVIAGSIFGVGTAKRVSAVRWQVALNMVAAWVITLPASALFGAGIYYLLKLFFK